MTIYATTVTTEAASAKDAYAKVQAYCTLYNSSHDDIITHVEGVFYNNQGDCCFLSGRLRLVTITARSIKWYDSACGKTITIIPSDATFTLSIRVYP